MLANHLYVLRFSEVSEQDASAYKQADLQDVKGSLYYHGSSPQEAERTHHECPWNSSSRGVGSVLRASFCGSCTQQGAKDHGARAADMMYQARRRCCQTLETT